MSSGGGTGLRVRLKIVWASARVGSTPTPSTKNNFAQKFFRQKFFSQHHQKLKKTKNTGKVNYIYPKHSTPRVNKIIIDKISKV